MELLNKIVIRNEKDAQSFIDSWDRHKVSHYLRVEDFEKYPALLCYEEDDNDYSMSYSAQGYWSITYLDDFEEMKLIPKDSILSELDRLRKVEASEDLSSDRKIDWFAGKLFAITCLEVFLDTLDTLKERNNDKEIDLEKEIDKFYGMYRKNGRTFSTENNEECLDWKVDCNPDFEIAFAKHFFELGKGK